MSALTPRLLVTDARGAQTFYADALGGEAGMCLAAPDGTVVHAEVTVAGVTFSLTEFGCQPSGDTDPQVLLHLVLDDPDTAAARIVQAGGEILIPIEDRFYGKREGRIRDPFGHCWILSKDLEDLSVEELQERMTQSMG
ncbi:MAG: VOC family protein [Myxococcales bacterium]|nr:VOC family protein [Myxococcales bacterium]